MSIKQQMTTKTATLSYISAFWSWLSLHSNKRANVINSKDRAISILVYDNISILAPYDFSSFRGGSGALKFIKYFYPL